MTVCRRPGTSRAASRGTGAPAVSRNSSVRGRSRNALAPADTVTTGCDAIASRSAEMSPVSSLPRCTPPIPPVANTLTPAAAAIATDADTVVAPTSQRCPTATATSRSAALRAGPRIRSCSSSVSPSRTTPSSTAVTAGTAPPARTAAVHRSSASRLCGDGSPRWEKIVDSSATTGRPSSIAARTSSEQTGVNTPPGYEFASATNRPAMSQPPE